MESTCLPESYHPLPTSENSSQVLLSIIWCSSGFKTGQAAFHYAIKGAFVSFVIHCAVLFNCKTIRFLTSMIPLRNRGLDCYKQKPNGSINFSRIFKSLLWLQKISVFMLERLIVHVYLNHNPRKTFHPHQSFRIHNISRKSAKIFWSQIFWFNSPAYCNNSTNLWTFWLWVFWRISTKTWGICKRWGSC